MKEFPDFLKEYESSLQKYKLDCIEIDALSLTAGKTLDIKSSKFLGQPYLPIGMDYQRYFTFTNRQR